MSIQIVTDEGWPPSLSEPTTLSDSYRVIDPAERIKVEIAYPLNKPVIVELATDNPAGFTADVFVTAIRETYQRIYREEEETTSTAVVPMEQRIEQNWLLVNRNETNGKYGIWGHDLGDLVLEGLYIEDGVWRLDIGS